MSTVLGGGEPGAGGSGGAARLFQVDSPHGLTADGFGNLFVAARREVKVVATGTPGTSAGGDDIVYTIYGQQPRDAFPEAVLVPPQMRDADSAALYPSSRAGHRTRMLGADE
jgi:hypothetical protein